MRFRLYREYGALNSVPVFDAFEKGLTSLGHDSVKSGEDVAVIWSVLWHGRMAANKLIYDSCLAANKPVIIIEVGNLVRNTTWRISLKHINALGEFSNDTDLDTNRPEKLGINLEPRQTVRRGEILIATQHEKSLQWDRMPSMKAWTEQMVSEVRKRTNRRIIVRPHPRSLFPIKIPNVMISNPKKISESYDDFDIFYNYHCVINHSSGPAVQAAIRGVPVICDPASLAGELSSKLDDIENCTLPDRTEWFLKLCHTEWTVDEIAAGVPLQRLIPKISEYWR